MGNKSQFSGNWLIPNLIVHSQTDLVLLTFVYEFHIYVYCLITLVIPFLDKNITEKAFF